MVKSLPAAVSRHVPAGHCLDDVPYRMVVFKELDGNNSPLYLVAGSDRPPVGAAKALKAAFALHGGVCFYCGTAPARMTLDHAEPVKLGGTERLQNLLIACQPCNSRKGCLPIEAFDPAAGRDWLSAVLRQVQDRLNRLPPAASP